MKQSHILLLSAALLIAIIGIIGLTALLTPQETPAFDAATQFLNAAGKGDEETAFALLSPQMQGYVQENCPDGRVTGCVGSYIPVEWGGFLSAVFRRSRPIGAAWDVLLIATYEEGQGFSGVCVYQRMEQDPAGVWKVFGWSGFISCDEPNAGLQDLAESPDAPHRAP